MSGSVECQKSLKTAGVISPAQSEINRLVSATQIEMTNLSDNDRKAVVIALAESVGLDLVRPTTADYDDDSLVRD